MPAKFVFYIVSYQIVKYGWFKFYSGVGVVLCKTAIKNIADHYETL